MRDDQIRKRVTELLAELKALKSEHPEHFEYVFQGSIHSENGILSVESSNLMDSVKSLPYYIEQLSKKFQFALEIKRFEMMKWAKAIRIVCIVDNLPPDLDAKQVKVNEWVKRGQVYRLIGLQANYETKELALNVTTLDGESVIPPLPYAGFSSDRFILDDYGKLN